MYLVIAEKPSVSQSLAKVIHADSRKDGYLEGSDCIVSWCLGHLAEYVSPEQYDEKYEKWSFEDLPILPQQWKLAVAKDKKKQYGILRDLLNRKDIEYVVNACDAGREGELIFQRVYELSECKLPVKRLWISSMEDAAIRDGFENLKDGKEYEHLCEASICRAKADWLIGMNATRAFTTQYYKRLVVGRVQTPTLAMLAERKKQIDEFQKEVFFRVTLEADGASFISDNITGEDVADTLTALCQGKDATVTSIKKTRKTMSPPRLYDLTTLQREANRYFGLTANETLATLQEMYENKIVTYPRTDSQYITEDMEDSIKELMEMIAEIDSNIKPAIKAEGWKRVVNNSKVTDHHAILLTKEGINSDFADRGMNGDYLYQILLFRMEMAIMEPCVYEETEIEVTCEGSTFRVKGKVVLEPGYQLVETEMKDYVSAQPCNKNKSNIEKESKPENTATKDLEEGHIFKKVVAKKSQHFTSPPKPYSEDTLLSAMEHAGNKEFDEDTEKKGLGTPATRASIIEKLVSSGYAVRKGKQILTTDAGIELITVLPEYLKSATLTAEWENQLLLMEKGQLAGEEFMEEIENLLTSVLNGCRQLTTGEKFRFHPVKEKESLGICPVCGKPVYESKKAFSCSNKECGFVLWKENRYLEKMKKKIDTKMAVELLAKGRTHVKDLYSEKKDKYFEADLLMDGKEGRVNFNLEFPKTGKGNTKKKTAGKKKSTKK